MSQMWAHCDMNISIQYLKDIYICSDIIEIYGCGSKNDQNPILVVTKGPVTYICNVF